MTQRSERADSALKPRFPRVQRILRRRRDERDLERQVQWFSVPGHPGMVYIKPIRR